MRTTKDRPGRPAGSDGGNRERILLAARDEFADKGFRGATMRSIAARSGVDVALIAHYFGNKNALYVTAAALPAEAQGILMSALSAPADRQGELLTHGYLGLWEDPATGNQLQILTRSALNNETATAEAHNLITGVIAGPETMALLAERRTGFMLAMTHLLGVALARHVIRLPDIRNLDLEELVARVSPAVQLHLDSADR